MTPTVQVNGWLQRVHDLYREVEFILQKGDLELQKKCFLSRFPRNCYSSYRLGKKISQRLIAVSQAITDANFDVVAYQLLRASVDEMPVENDTVGLDSLLEEVWSCLEEIDVSSIGLCGIGRVGKTTLLKKINNELLIRSHNFDVVIWVVASKEVNMEKTQEVILKQIRDCRSYMGSSSNESKVVFTSRSRDVCGLMEAQRRIKVACLAREEAINLFQMKVGGEILKSHPDIPKLAKVVMEEYEGTGDHVFRVLKFSYDSLPSVRVKDCFLYCSVFPEDYNIRKDELIKLWIGEGLLVLDEHEDIPEEFRPSAVVYYHEGFLLEELGRLEDLEDIRITIHSAIEQQRMTPTVQVNGWLQRVHDLYREVEFILQKGDLELQKKGFLSRFPRNCYSSYRLGKKISKRLIAVSQVGVAIFTHIHEESQAITDANFDVVSYQLLRASVDEMPMENDSVGLDSLLEEVWSCLEDIDVSSIGLCGIGRVGKTTLLKKINNELLIRSHNFDVVIWVVASKEVNMEKTQEVILKQIRDC
nr:putative disease resistance protein [Quercus suber]